MHKTLGSLNLHRPNYRAQTAGGVALQNTAEVKAQLLRELVELEKQVNELEAQSGVDFALQQTCREMIHSRRSLFMQLDR